MNNRTKEYRKFVPTVRTFAQILGANVTIGAFTQVDDYAVLDAELNGGYVYIGCRSKIKRGAILKAYDGFVAVGDRVSIGEYCVLQGHGGISIGDACIIGPHCVFASSDHVFMLDRTSIRFQGETAQGISVGKNVWIGANVVILDGVSIGEGCIVGAGSVVTRDLPANYVCIGSPCRAIKKRDPCFDYEEFEVKACAMHS